MPKLRIYELDYMRAVAMLGVLGIHTGAFAVADPHVNIHFFLLTDILTRFSVPMFFFISAFGLFLSQNPLKPFNYAAFLKRRINVVLIPYIIWSLLYMLHQNLVGEFPVAFNINDTIYALFFGFGGYHLYFLVILLWFYALMPVWCSFVAVIVRQPIIWLAFLYVLQSIFNYYSVFLLQANTGYNWLDTAIKYRLNYWVIHYLFIFLLGAVCANLYPSFIALLTRYRRVVVFMFISSVASMLAYYYHLIYNLGYTCEATAYTLQQLHPLGLFYTLAMTLMLFLFFHHYANTSSKNPLATILRALGANSYLIYLVHPMVMHYLNQWITAAHYPRTVPVNTGFYLATALISYLIARVIYRGQEILSPLSLLTGSPKPQRPRTVPGQQNINS